MSTIKDVLPWLGLGLAIDVVRGHRYTNAELGMLAGGAALLLYLDSRDEAKAKEADPFASAPGPSIERTP